MKLNFQASILNLGGKDMADNKNFPDLHHIKEAICIDTNRVYDSCADKDCLTDIRVYLTDRGQ